MIYKTNYYYFFKTSNQNIKAVKCLGNLFNSLTYTFIILFIVLELLALIGTIGLEMDDFDGGYDAG